MAKTLCDWSKRDIEANSGKLQQIVQDPQYFCRKCARVACQKRYLCKGAKFAGTATPPMSLKELANSR